MQSQAKSLSKTLTRWAAVAASAFVVVIALSTNAVAAEDAANTETVSFMSRFGFYWLLAAAGSVAALYQAYVFFKWMMASDAGNPTMVEIAGYVREGANAYLRQQYKIVGAFFVVIFALLAYAAYGLHAQDEWVPFAFITGGFFSGLAGWFGMKTATWASSRTAAGAQKSLNQGLQVAFRSGAVMGLTVVGLGLLDIVLWFLVLYWIMPVIGGEVMSLTDITVTMLCFGMGASSQALFARVGGGIFTKAADVGADLVGKVEQGIPEDDPRNPATIADNVGDNVGDVAGMGADLYESFCGSILASAALGVAAFMGNGELQLSAIFLPMTIAGAGTLLSIAGIYLVRTEENATQKTLLAALGRGINAATLLSAVAAFALTYMLLGKENWQVAISVAVGLLAGWLIGKWTEYSTSNDYKPTQQLADQSLTGPATLIIGGVAEGMMSTWVPIVVICSATLAAFGFSNGWNFSDPNEFALGLYGVGIAAVGMLSTLGITLATDAYGPIADNAGGNAQMAGLEPIVRERTDALDCLGNTTAATGKGFAIGSAALTALALLAAYVEEVRVGFDRWGDSVVGELDDVKTKIKSIQDGIDKDQDVPEVTELGVYKINNLFAAEATIVVKTSGKKKEAKIETHGLLPMPGAIRKESIPKAWNELDATENPVPADAIIGKVEGDAQWQFTATGELLVPVKNAKMADFMRYYDVTLMNPKVLIGVLLGSMAVFVFCAMTMKAVGRAAKGMVEEVRRQFREKPGIMQGTDKPDYASPVAISTKAAQREMVVPSLLALLIPVVTGLVFGVAGVMGLLVGGLATGFCVAIFMANAGGAWDNAKKHIEGGVHGGKGTDAHKAAVVGDTVGDPFKDTSGPSLNILIKLMSMVSVVVAGLIVRYSLAALGIF